MSREVPLYPPGNKLHLHPNFSKCALSDGANISEALNIVLQARNKALSVQQKDQMNNRTKSWLKGANSVSALRKVDDEEWANLKLPVMARIYLKTLVNQAHDLSEKEILECHFNMGQPFNLEKWEEQIKHILHLGFSRKEALEGLAVNDGSLQQALDYIMAPPQDQEWMSNKARREQKKDITYDYHYTVILALEKAEKQRVEWSKKPVGELKGLLRRMQAELNQVRERRHEDESKLADSNNVRNRELFKAFMSGILANSQINPTEMRQVNSMREKRGLTDDQFREILKELGTSHEKLETMKQYDTHGAQDKDECCICLDAPRTTLVQPCNHLCMCEECAEDFEDISDESRLCPICKKKIERMTKINNLDQDLGVMGPG